MKGQRIVFEPDHMYHVYNHENAKDNIFRSDENYFYFLKKYAQYLNAITDTYAYCLMPNHFHFLVRIKSADQLMHSFVTKSPETNYKLANTQIDFSKLISQQYSNFLNAYAKAFNKQYNRKGSLFLDNVKRKLIKDESYFTKLVHYIHYNPVHHGFVDKINDWKYSSYHSLISAKPTALKRREVLD
jgi:REP element-mobilizing transposase RayT